jgi:hypothetical protein
MPPSDSYYRDPKAYVMFVGPALLGTSLIILIGVELAAWPAANSGIDFVGWGMKVFAWAVYGLLFWMAFKGSEAASKLLATGMLIGVIMVTLGHWSEIIPMVAFPTVLAPLQSFTAPITARPHILLVLSAVLPLLGPVVKYQERVV